VQWSRGVIHTPPLTFTASDFQFCRNRSLFEAVLPEAMLHLKHETNYSLLGTSDFLVHSIALQKTLISPQHTRFSPSVTTHQSPLCLSARASHGQSSSSSGGGGSGEQRGQPTGGSGGQYRGQPTGCRGQQRGQSTSTGSGNVVLQDHLSMRLLSFLTSLCPSFLCTIGSLPCIYYRSSS
jgi:hypothetical protein